MNTTSKNYPAKEYRPKKPILRNERKGGRQPRPPPVQYAAAPQQPQLPPHIKPIRPTNPINVQKEELMKPFNFNKKIKHLTARPLHTATNTGKATSSAEEPRRFYNVAIQWYDSKNITTERVAAHNATEAVGVIRRLFTGKALNKDYGIVNIMKL